MSEDKCPLGPEECYKLHYMEQELSAVRNSNNNLKAQLASQAEEITRLKRCYESATGKPVCREGAVIRVECREMTKLRDELAAKDAREDELLMELALYKAEADNQAELIREAVKTISSFDESWLHVPKPQIAAYEWCNTATALLPRLEAAIKEQEPLYPCADCGTLRTKAEGGTTFTVCDRCWEKRQEKHDSKEKP